MAIRSYNVIELCAGVHGLGLGINIAEPRARSIAHVEREASAAATLVARMEAGELAPAPIWSDVTTFDARGWSGRVHCVASGDPCQPNSVAGNRLGSDDDRFLIEHVVRIYGESGADRLFRENVTENADGQLAALVPPLEAMGCRIAAGIFSAAEVGASHRRERLFIMADRKGGGCRIVGDAARSRGRGHPDGGDAAMANTDGAGFHVGGNRSLESNNAHAGTSLTDATVRGELWATPKAISGGANSKRDDRGAGGPDLQEQVTNWELTTWPTPRARDHKGGGPTTERADGRTRLDQLDYAAEQWKSSSPPVQPTADGPPSSPPRRVLNPQFVEWLMGWPIGWTDLEPVETGLSHWLPRMRGYLSALCSRPADRQNSLFWGIIYLTPETLSGRYLLVMGITLWFEGEIRCQRKPKSTKAISTA
jgi:site-specific DNA-cytosine methylase